jgi:predicted RNA-binding protein associated with RNAse of E/G family
LITACHTSITLSRVGTTITPQLVDVVDTASRVRKYSSGTVRRLTGCRVERWGLLVECPTPDDPFYVSEMTWLLPELHIRLTRQQPRSRHAIGGPTVLTAVRVQRDGTAWHTTDLLLGLATAGNAARIVGSEDFAAAVAGGVIRPRDADLAIGTIHKTLEELSMCRHDLGAWLTHQRIFEVWPPH